MKFFSHILVACTGLAVGSSAIAGTHSKSHHETLLVTTKDSRFASTRAAVKSIGTVVGKDEESGLYKVRLASGIEPVNAKASLRKLAQVAVAINGDQAHIDQHSDDQVTDHLRYLQQCDRHERKIGGAGKRDTLDWYGTYQHWLHDHVNKQGIFDPYEYIQGAKIRDAMPTGIATAGQMNPMTSGAWSYVGPHNEQPVPGRLYDGLGPLTGRINAVAVDPTNANNVYVCSAGGGAWRSADRGVTWVPMSDGWQSMQASSIAVDRNNTKNLYVGTGDFAGSAGYPFGIMKSTDGGATWNNYGASVFGVNSISHIAVDPANSNIVIATAGRGASGLGGIYRSTNAGLTWAKTAAPSTNWDGLSVSVPDGTGKRTFWAAGEASTTGLIYKSVNEGATWTKVTIPVVARKHTSIDVACSKISNGTVYVLDPNNAGATSGNHIWKTTNGGTSWKDVVAGFPNGDPNNGAYYTWDQNDYNFYIGTSIINNGGVKTDGVFIGLITICMSDDGGATWFDVSQSYQDQNTALSHVDQHAFFADPISANTVYFGNDGGVHRMTYDPVNQIGTFKPLNLSLYATQWYFVAVHPTDTTKLMGGLQDNACPVSTGNLNLWTNPGQGDGSAVSYDPFNPNIAYNSTQNLGVFRTTNDWTSEADISDPGGYNNESVNQFPPIITGIKGTAASPLYAGTDHLWRWDATNKWVGDIGGQNLTGGANLRIIAVCPSDKNRVYTGSDDGELWEVNSLNLGVNANAIEVDNNAFGSSPVVSIAPLPTNAKDVLAGVAQAGGANLFRCANVDATNPAWVDVTGTGTAKLPPLPVNAIVRDPAAPTTTWYVGMDVGVFMTTNAGVTWINLTNPHGLPNVQVNSLVANPYTGYLYAGTYGRGLWKILLQPLCLASLTVSPGTVTGGVTNATGTITLSSPAKTSYVVNVTSSDPATASVPATVTILAGKQVGTFTITTNVPNTSPEKVTITIKTVNTKTATLTVN